MAVIKRLNTTKFTFKKLAMGAAITGLVIVPSIAAAESATTTTGTTNTSSTTPTTSTASTTGATVIATPTTGNSSTDSTSTAASTPTDSTTTSVTTTTGTNVPTTSNTDLSTSVTFQQAVDTAQSFFSTKTIVKAVLLESRSNNPVYMVVFSDGSRVYVDANSGSVVYSYDTVSKASTGTNPLGDKDDSDADNGKDKGDQKQSHASLTGQTESNARGSQGLLRRD